MTHRVHLQPPEGQSYRDPATGQLIPAEGQLFDIHDLDTARAIKCGDLVHPPKAAKAKAAAGSQE